MSRMEKDFEFTYGNRINWYMLFFAIVAGKAAKDHEWGDEHEVEEYLMVDEILNKFFKVHIFDKDVSKEEYGKSKITGYNYINPSRV